MNTAWIKLCVPVLVLSCLCSNGQRPSADNYAYASDSLVQFECSVQKTVSAFQGISGRYTPMAKKKMTYFQNIWVLLSQFSLGMVNTVSVSAGLVPLFLYPGSHTPVLLIPKVTIPLIREKWLLSAGVLIGKMAGNCQSEFFIAYSTTSYGSPGKYISMGIGYGRLTGGWAARPEGCFRPQALISKKSLSDDYGFEYTPGNSLLTISVGGHKSLKHVGIDFGVFIPVFEGQDFMVIYPWIGISIPLHQQIPQL